ncbi:sigma 54-interacting transcriptional regulator, partial [bacterium]|nr:sigma 54-interacting transcriptional regulator [bacterium]
LFLPVYDKESLVGYIIIERFARARELGKNAEFYSNIDRDQMVVFATYLGNIIHLLRNRNLNALIAQEKELQEELYDKHQKINQYKESIRSFLRTNKQRKIGIIFYKNRRFTFGNQTAQDLVQVNINTHEGHPISRALKKAAQQALEYKSQQTCFVQDSNGNKLVVSAIPNIEQNNVIITIYYPEISDILKKRIELLSDPTKWDYLLYLETTKSGKLIDQLIPGSGETLLNFKINLLKISLSKKAILIDMPNEDLMPTVELLHHISLRERLYVLSIQKKSKNFDLAIKLFGINPIFGLQKPDADPLLQTLDGIGTLFIENIHLLNIEEQEYLAEFLKYGMYKTFKSDKKTASNVRIICSTNKNLPEMVRDGTFNKELFDELNKTQLVMPSLVTLSEDELKNLAVGFSQQALKKEAFKNLLELTDTEKRKIALTRPASLQELKTRVQQLLSKKSKNNELYEETQFDPAFSISDPNLIEATRLGKHALKDPKIMTMLWNKFKNQNKIATLLGVNRSSVNRRCKEYKLIP